MAKRFNVIGAHAVGGVDPGGVVSLDLPEANIDALIASGAIEPVKAAKTTSKGVSGGDADPS